MDELKENDLAIVAEAHGKFSQDYLGALVEITRVMAILDDLDMYRTRVLRLDGKPFHNLAYFEEGELIPATIIPSKQYEAMLELYQFCFDNNIAGLLCALDNGPIYELGKKVSRIVEEIEEWLASST